MPVAEQPLLRIARLYDQAHDYAKQSKADHTLRAYRSDWKQFCCLV